MVSNGTNGRKLQSKQFPSVTTVSKDNPPKDPFIYIKP
jgi:hypothetical protein